MISSLATYALDRAMAGSPPSQLQYLNWRLIYACNYRCPMCQYWRSAPPHRPIVFPAANLAAFTEDLAAAGLRYARLNGGEPTLHPHITDIISLLAARGVVSEIVTNGSPTCETWSRLIAAGLARINLSVDSYLEADADRMRGTVGAFRHSDELLRHLALYHPEVYVSINCVLCGWNYGEDFMRRFVTYYGALNVRRVSFSLMDRRARGRNKPHQAQENDVPALDRRQVEQYLTEAQMFDTVRYTYEGVEITLNPFVHGWVSRGVDAVCRALSDGRLGAYINPHILCIQPWIGVNVLENGDCYPCLSTVYTPAHRLGNVLHESVRSLFWGSRIERFRASRGRSCKACCLLCKDHQQRNVYWSGAGKANV